MPAPCLINGANKVPVCKGGAGDTICDSIPSIKKASQPCLDGCNIPKTYQDFVYTSLLLQCGKAGRIDQRPGPEKSTVPSPNAGQIGNGGSSSKGHRGGKE
ncbi:hypothetical protein NLG97_g1170 [Lecanicillium saksenae]|uniref:Uncharacterized protein n=1 Tax=Lecanicillium saksenae TaxID=468837 RepID=A0ACC1R682_9HYPO|nr:hypothetical protein NLG97_g1170 [Lecanicillium saksenae]